ncbi:MAG: hypothetical protein COB07_00030 [Sulfurovum sp.]|nr:MAG: hypothetical protein COB07_00030 [Sulfurovum sp.]
MTKKISVLLATTCMVFAAESGTLSQMVKNIDANVTQKEMKMSNPHKTKNNNPFYEGEVMTVEQGGAYTYLEVKEESDKTFWVAVNSAEVKVGDYVRFQKELVTQNFKSKALDRTFDELMFASSLQYKIQK